MRKWPPPTLVWGPRMVNPALNIIKVALTVKNGNLTTIQTRKGQKSGVIIMSAN